MTGPMRGKILLVAFEGWTDAGDAASEALRLVIREAELEPIDSIPTEQFHDYTFVRPIVRRNDEGKRTLAWPETLFLAPTKPSKPASIAEDAGFDMVDSVDGSLYALLGIEPNRNWTLFTQTVIDLVQRYDIDSIVFLGSMLADVPHTRSTPVHVTSDDAALRELLDVARSEYEGPAGIMTMISMEAAEVDIPSVSIWASVPHYVHSAPVPKATVALLDRLGEIIDYAPPLGDLPEEVREWESGVSEFASQDEEMRAYIDMLEERRDTVDSPKASGEALAKEFERFLQQRRDSDAQADQAEGDASSDDDTPPEDAPPV